MSKKRLTFKKTDAGVQAYSELHLRDFIKQIPTQQTTKSVGEEIEKLTKSRIRVVEELLNEVITNSNKFNEVSQFIQDVDNGVYGASKKGPRLSTADVRANFQRVKEDMIDIGKAGGKTLSHVGISNLAIHLYSFYVSLRSFGGSINWTSPDVKTKTGGQRTGLYTTETGTDPSGRPIPEYKEVLTKERSMTNAEFFAFTEDIRRLYIMAKAVAEMPVTKFTGSPFRDMETALRDYFNKGQDHHFIGKEQVVNVAAGIADAELTFEQQGRRSDLELILGKEKMALLGIQEKNDMLKNINNYFGNKFDQLVGSPSIKEDVIKGLSEQLVTGKKPKTRKHTGKYENKKKIKQPARAKKVQTDIGKTLTKAGIAAAAMSKVRTPAKGEAPGQKPKRGADEAQLSPKELGYLKRKINTRLPQQVAENMGRPALNFQTGRFANSTRLVDLKQGDKNLIGKYTYMLNPYETFENTGRYRWPTGYNPKPLIAQSIRELAEQYTNKKFTLRRQ